MIDKIFCQSISWIFDLGLIATPVDDYTSFIAHSKICQNVLHTQYEDRK